ncbi:MAG: ABC transporter permease [Promethearchaeota archaeon]
MSLNVLKAPYSPSIWAKGIYLGQIFFGKVLSDKKTYILIFVGVLPIIPFINESTLTVYDFVEIVTIKDDSRTLIFNFLILPLICLILGISAISDEKENKTISQLLSRPIKREEIVLVKWITVLVIGIIIACLDTLIIYAGLCILINDFTIFHLDVLFGVWLYVALWVTVYSTIFLFLGIIIDKNATGWGLAIAYFEAFFGQFIFGPVANGGNSVYSISNQLYFVTSEYFLADYFTFNIPDFEPLVSLIICIFLIVGFLLLSMVTMRRKDFP